MIDNMFIVSPPEKIVEAVDEEQGETDNTDPASILDFTDLDVNELDGLAIMSDTDNSKMKAIAYYQNIYFSAN